MPSQTHALGLAGPAEGTSRAIPTDRVAWKSEPVREQEVKRRESIVAKGTFYIGVLAVGVLNVYAEGSPLESFLGAVTLLANVGVGAAFIWALIEPPRIDTAPFRLHDGFVRKFLGRLRLRFAVGDDHQIVRG